LVGYITLSKGNKAIVDDEDYEYLTQTKWSDDSHGYAIRHAFNIEGIPTTEKMHRIIMNAEPHQQVDHINGIPWDNRKSNLRLVTNAQNSANKDRYSTNKSGYKGVAVYNKGRWTAQITVNYRKIHLGCFDDPKEAALAYNEAAVKYFGEYAKLNVV
jgi:hypothetical protein